MSLIEIERAVDVARDKYAVEEGYISSSEKTSPWLPFLSDNTFVRYLTFDVRTNTTVALLKVVGHGGLGIHRHRGPVEALTLKGSWRYEEYDWVSSVGDFVRESPGRTHTLVSDNGMETLFHVHGSIEFLDEHENTFLVLDTFWMINHYEEFCKKKNIPINSELFL